MNTEAKAKGGGLFKWLRRMLWLFLLLIGGVLTIGTMLPTNYQSSHFVDFPHHSVREVWAVLHQPEKVALSYGVVSRRDLPDQDGDRVWEEDIRGTKVTVRMKSDEAGLTAVFTLKDPANRWTTQWTFQVVPGTGRDESAKGCRVTATESGDTGKGLSAIWGRVMIRIFPDFGTTNYLERVAEHLSQ